jgi:hypothetical protein
MLVYQRVLGLSWDLLGVYCCSRPRSRSYQMVDLCQQMFGCSTCAMGNHQIWPASFYWMVTLRGLHVSNQLQASLCLCYLGWLVAC